MWKDFNLENESNSGSRGNMELSLVNKIILFKHAIK